MEICNHAVKRRVVSLQHTGTRLMCKLLRCSYWHVDNPLVQLEDLDGLVVVSPLRQPEMVWHSWLKRVSMPVISRAINTQVNETVEQAHTMFMRNLALFASVDTRYSPFYVPIDLTHLRAERLARLSCILNEPLSVDWNTRIGHAEAPVPDAPDIDWDYVYSLPMFKDYL